MLDAFTQQRATISALARSVGATVTAFDVGVGVPTGDIRDEPAMDAERFDATVAARRSLRSTRSTPTCS